MNLQRNTFNKGKNSDVSKTFVSNENFIDSENLVFFSEGEDVSAVPAKGVTRSSWDKNWRSANLNLSNGFKVIGAKESEDRKRVFMFVLGVENAGPAPDYNDTEFVLEYTKQTDSFAVVLGGIDLGFSFNYPIESHGIVNLSTSENEYLAWTDKNMPTRFIDINKAKSISAQIQTDVVFTDIDLDRLINLITTPPLTPPSYVYQSDENVESISLATTFPSFKYRYIYFDGSVSAFSVESKFVPVYQLDNIDYSETTKKLNSIEVTYNVDSTLIKYIEVAVREGDTGIWYALPQIPYVSVGTHTLKYYRNDSKTALGDTPLNTKYYDNVPIKNRALTYSNSRLVLGGFTEGYSEIEDFKAIASPIYTGVTGNVDLEFTINNQNTLTASSSLSLAELQLKSEIGDTLSLYIQAWVYTNAGGLETDNTSVSSIFGITITSWATILSEIGDLFVASVNIGPPGEQWLSCTGVTYSIVADVITFNYTLTGNAISNWVSPIGFVLEDNTTYLGGQQHKQHIVYFDEYNRQSDAVSSEDFTMFVKPFHKRNQNYNEKVGTTQMLVNIISTPPEWAVRYAICSSGVSSVPYHRMTITESILTDATAPAGIEMENRVRIYLKDMSTQQKGTTWRNYQYQEGQYMVVMGGGASPSVSTWKIVDLEVDPVYIVDGGLDTVVDLSYDWLYIEIMESDYARLSIAAQASGISAEHLFIDIIDYNNESTGVTREVGEVFEIGDPGLPTRYHKGNVVDQSTTSTTYNDIPLTKTANNLYTLAMTVGSPTILPNQYLEIDGIPAVVMVVEPTTPPVPVIVYSNQDISEGNKTVVFKQAAQSLINRGNSYGHNRAYNADPQSISSVKNYIYSESNHISDYFPSEQIGYGRAHIDVNELRQTDRFAGLMGSSPFVEDSNIFGLTDFPNNAYPFIWLETNNGNIEGLVPRDNDVVVIQSQKVGRVLINKSVLTTADGNGSVSVTDIVFGQYVPYFTDNGTRGNDWSIRNHEGRIYFKSNDSAYRLSNDGLTAISDYGMINEFKDGQSESKLSAINRRRGEYLVNLNGRMETFNENLNAWLSAITVTPDFMTELDDQVVSFIGNDNGLYLLIHEDSNTYSELFDANGDLVTVVPYIDLASNREALDVKSFGSVELVGSSLSSVTATDVETDNQTSGDILSFQPRENTWVASLNMGKSKNTYGAEYIGLGIPSSIFGNILTYNTALDTTSFSVGDSVFYLNNGAPVLAGTIQSYTENEIVIDGPLLDGNGFFHIVNKNSDAEGTSLKGLYLAMRLEFNTSFLFRLDAVKVFSTTSKID